MDAPLPTSAIYESIHNDDDGTTKPEKDKEARKAIVDEIVDKAMRARSDLERLVLR